MSALHPRPLFQYMNYKNDEKVELKIKFYDWKKWNFCQKLSM